MSDMKYLDFDLALEPSGAGYTARVFNSPGGQAVSEFTTPFSDLEVENFLLRVGRSRHAVRRVESPEMASAKAFGAKLFNGVFAGDVRGCLRSSLDEASRQGAGLRVRLHLAKAPALADLPWEFLYNASMNRFLSLSVETPLVRYLDLPERIRPLAVTPPLRVLMMISSPSDYPQLDVARESAKIHEALGDLEKRGLVTVERQEEATLAELQRRLRQSQYHIFHFVGHGGFDQQADDGLLILEDQEERGRRVSAQFLGTLLHDHRPLRLAVLNACEGARASRGDPFAGTAQSLVQQGIPAVIAMQFEVTDEAAICFTREFYSAIAGGYPVDAALSEARKAIFAEVSEIEWGTPVLYMRAPDGRIFEVEQLSDRDRQDQLVASLLTAADTAAAAGDFRTASDKLNEILSVAADHAGAQERLRDIARQQELAETYAGARAAFDSGRWHDALSALRRIQAIDRGYRDVEALMAAANTALDAAAEEDRRRKARERERIEAAARERERADAAAREREREIEREREQQTAGARQRERERARMEAAARADASRLHGDASLHRPVHPAAAAVDMAQGRTAGGRGVKPFLAGGLLGALLIMVLIGVGAVLVAGFVAGQSSVPSSPSADVRPPADDTPADPEPARLTDVKASDNAPPAVTPALAAILRDVIIRGDNAEIQAYRTLDPTPLYSVYTGNLLAKHLADLRLVASNGVVAVNTLSGQRFDGFSVSPDGRRAEVRFSETWSTNFFSILTKQCVSHFHEHEVPQTVLLELTSQGWMAYDSRQDSPTPQLAPCH